MKAESVADLFVFSQPIGKYLRRLFFRTYGWGFRLGRLG